ncbi:sensor domain-containing phosphodiesterase [Marinobacter salinisoli]|uniref:Sensor domain-containing phosphodiesterase n=1 Tax=Marinobacter salinisoli TaxID=2769486 RepID=A0ABX7MMS5_9GAMM|nr:sensor domain-containing phosphodiesterase [Marinobacter salinisoli]QSP93349.1 sensor domain-containing phosphodiesterase [Marinobacter salinisoli]
MSENRLFTDFHERLMKLSHSPEFIQDEREQKLAALTELCASALEVERVSIWQLSHGHEQLTCEYLHDAKAEASGAPRYDSTHPLVLLGDEHPRYFEALCNARVIDASDAQTDERTNTFSKGYLTALGIQSMLDAPIFDGSRPSGVICLEAMHRRTWTLPELSFVAALADTVSLINTHEAWVESKRKLDYVTHFDTLTGLANLNTLRERMGYQISKARRHGHHHFLLIWTDLDRLKTINDGLGPQIGDAVIAEIGRRLGEMHVPGKDVLARIGGDEFALLLTTVPRGQELDKLNRRILETISQPIETQGQSINVTASLGTCRFPGDGRDVDDLLRSAEAAMYHAKSQGPNQARPFDNSIQATARSRFALERELRLAIHERKLDVFYQPIFDNSGKQMVGAEALVRWHHPERGLLPPIEFLEVARGAGLMRELGECVLHRVCQDIQHASRQKLNLPVISVNLASEQVLAPNLPEDIQAICAEYRVSPGRLHFEVTEDAIQGDSQILRNTLTKLVEAGSALSIDDFGTGYSSLSRLKSLPFSRIKVDRSFIRDIPGDEDDCAITLSIIGLARGLGLDIVAEGVESEEHERWLRAHDCQFLQGFKYSKPVPFNELVSKFLSPANAPAHH